MSVTPSEIARRALTGLWGAATTPTRRYLTVGLATVLASAALASATAPDPADDDAAVARHIQTLSDPDGKTRAAAAAELRRIVAKYPSGTIYLQAKDGGEAGWQEKVKKVVPGMKKEEVLKLLPKFEVAPEGAEIADGDSHVVSYRLDYHWTVRISYRNTDKVIDPPVLARRAYRVHVAAPPGFTGTWTTWHVNGQKGYEIEYTART